MNQVYASQRYIKRGLGCNCRPGFGDDLTDNAGSGGGYYDAPPADSGSDYIDPSYFDSSYYGSDYWDPINGVYYDTYGNIWSAPIGGDPGIVGDTITTNEYDYWTGGDIDLSVLNQTPSWLNELNADPSIGTLPAAHVPPQLILQIPDSGIVPPGLVLPSVLNALPPKKLAALKKALQNQVQKAAQAGASGGASSGSAARPQTVQPSANKTCPPGYTLNAAKTACMLNQQPSTSGSFMALLQNPLVWVLVLGAVVLAKR